MPLDKTGMEADEWARASEPGKSNDIIILGKRYPLVRAASDRNKAPRVRNFLDDPSLDFRKAGLAKGYVLPLVRPRKGDPQTIDALRDKIRFAVLHADLTRHARRTFEILLGRQLSSHFCINWDGVIYQYADVAVRTAHAGETNDESIGIDMNHALVRETRDPPEVRRDFAQRRAKYLEMKKRELREQGLVGKGLRRALERYEWERPKSARIQGMIQTTWGYTPRQYESLILLLKLFVRELGLAKSYPMTADGAVIPHMLEEEELGQLEGFVAHWHLSDMRWDPGPAFDWKRVLSGIQNEYNWFPLAWTPELILQGRDVAQAEAAAWELFRNTETAEHGGTFPIGANQTWHGGVHLYPPVEEDRPRRHAVHAMFDGVVVAAHFEPGRRDLGHNNFVLLRHDVDLPKRGGGVNEDGTPQTETLRFFSLYAHLDSMDVSEGGAKDLRARYERLTWVSRLHDLEALRADPDEFDKAVANFEAELEQRRREIEARLDAGEVLDEELEALVVDVEEDLEEGAEVEAAEFLTVGYGGPALVDPARVAVLVSDEFQLKVSAGEVLGFAGALPSRDPDASPVGVHVEVFTDAENFHRIDLDTHAEHFRTPQRSRSADLTVRTEDILAIFRESARDRRYAGVQVWPEDRVSPDEVRAFFAAAPRRKGPDRREAWREQLRRSITYHVSEWSDQVDWIASLTGGQPWDKETRSPRFREYVRNVGMFSSEIRRFLPFVWLTKEVATEVGLSSGAWDGRVYHYHPIHFVMWLTYHAVRRNRVFRTSLSLREVMARRKRAARIRELVARGRKAKADGKWERFERRLDRALKRDPFRLKPGEEYDELRTRIVNGVQGEFEVDEEAGVHGVVEGEEPLFSNPGEVLDELFALPGRFEWKILGRSKE